MNTLAVKILALSALLGLVSCQTSSFSDCESLVLKSAKKKIRAVMVYEDDSLGDASVSGYVSTKAKIKITENYSDDAHEVKVLSGSKLKGESVWVKTWTNFTLDKNGEPIGLIGLIQHVENKSLNEQMLTSSISFQLTLISLAQRFINIEKDQFLY